MVYEIMDYSGGMESVWTSEIKPAIFKKMICQVNLKQAHQTLQSSNDGKIISYWTYKSIL